MIAERIDTVVLPGDVVGELTTEHESQQQQKRSLQIGSGCVVQHTHTHSVSLNIPLFIYRLRQESNRVLCTRAGVLRQQENLSFFYVESRGKRYVAAGDDLVIGVIQDQVTKYKLRENQIKSNRDLTTPQGWRSFRC